MPANDDWQADVLLTRSPTYQFSSETVDGTLILESQIKLAPDQAKDLLAFLRTQKKSPEYLASRDNEEAEDTVSTVFRLIAVHDGMQPTSSG